MRPQCLLMLRHVLIQPPTVRGVDLQIRDKVTKHHLADLEQRQSWILEKSKIAQPLFWFTHK